MALKIFCHGCEKNTSWLWEDSIRVQYWLLLLMAIFHPDGFLLIAMKCSIFWTLLYQWTVNLTCEYWSLVSKAWIKQVHVEQQSHVMGKTIIHFILFNLFHRFPLYLNSSNHLHMVRNHQDVYPYSLVFQAGTAENVSLS